MKIKHQITVTVFEDDSVKFAFQGAETWAIGRMQRVLNRATRHLKAEHRLARVQRDREIAAEKEEQSIADAAQAVIDKDAA